MLYQSEYIGDLILFEISGHITERQLAYLNFVIEALPEAALLKRRIMERLSDPRVQENLGRLEQWCETFLKNIAKEKGGLR